jgi:erythromycin esterase
VPRGPATFTGIAAYDDGSPATGSTIAVTEIESSKLVDVLTVDAAGAYKATLPPGMYALAVAGARGFAWIEKQVVPSTGFHLTLSRSCHPLTGKVDGHATSTRVHLERQSYSQGDTFVAPVREDGSFAFCLSEGQYRLFLTGDALSVSTKLELPTTTRLRVRGTPSSEIKLPPAKLAQVPGGLDVLVADIVASDPRIVGLGEATHGTAEFFTARGALSMELIRQANVRLLLFEFDAIAGAALDDYVNGADIDPAKAVADLSFWTTDTHEFLQFLAELRQHNAMTSDKVHIWGVDVQNTTHPVDVLVASADELSIGAEDIDILRLLIKRGKGVRELSAPQRASIDTLLSRLGTPRGTRKHDLLVAVAAQSLATQLEYWTGDMETWIRKRRDIGMARLTDFIITQTGTRRACLWAHDGHVTKQPSELMLGHYLTGFGYRYYAVGFYLYQGSTRAVDTAGKIGVISYPVPVAPKYTVENVVLEGTGRPEIAWLPLRTLPPAWKKWLETPRLSRELGAVYTSEDDMMMLRDIRAAFDAVVVIRTGHDSSPTPTGVRVFKH